MLLEYFWDWWLAKREIQSVYGKLLRNEEEFASLWKKIKYIRRGSQANKVTTFLIKDGKIKRIGIKS